MIQQAKRYYEFGGFRVDPIERLLLRNGEVVRLTPKVFDTLLILVENSGRVLTRAEMMHLLWPDTAVEEANLTTNISTLRRALGESESERQFIETIPWRGYKFIAGVREVENGSVDLTAQRSARSPLAIEPPTNGENPATWPEIAPHISASAKENTIRKVNRLTLGICAVLAFALVIGVYFLTAGRAAVGAVRSPIRTIAVLPFTPINAAARDEYLELGMADAVISKLGGLKQITVRPTASVRRYADVEQDPVAAGKELQVESVLVGSTQRLGDRIRVTVQLVSVPDGRPLWSYRCDDYCADVFTAQDSISEKVAVALMLKLTGEEQKKLAKHYTDNIEAYQLYLRGRYHLDKRSASDTEQSIDYFEQAITIDPNYALAYAGLAEAYASLCMLGPKASPRDVLPRANAAAARSLDLDADLAEAHLARAFVLSDEFTTGYDFNSVERECRRAIELNPNLVNGRRWFALYLAEELRFDEAVAEIKRALEIDPASPASYKFFAHILYLARRYDEAIEQAQTSLELDPYFRTTYPWLMQSYEEKGQYDLAFATMMKHATVVGADSKLLEAHRKAYAAAGWKGFWRESISDYREEMKRGLVEPCALAKAYLRIGDQEEAIRWLERAAENQSPQLAELRADPIWDSLRSNPRFGELLRRLGLL